MKSSRTAEGRILYECSLNIEAQRRFVHLRCANGFRWKLPAEPDTLLPITCACSDAIQSITEYIALASRAVHTSGQKKQFLQRAANEAVLAGKKAALPLGETKDTLYGHRDNCVAQCILFPRWIPRDWPVPSFGQSLEESFKTLADQILRAVRSWPANAEKIVFNLNGFWEQLQRAERAALASPSSWTVYQNPVFDDSAFEVRPTFATALYNRLLVEGPRSSSEEELCPSLTEDDGGQLAQLLEEYLHDELQGVSSGDVLADEPSVAP